MKFECDTNDRLYDDLHDKFLSLFYLINFKLCFCELYTAIPMQAYEMVLDPVLLCNIFRLFSIIVSVEIKNIHVCVIQCTSLIFIYM